MQENSSLEIEWAEKNQRHKPKNTNRNGIIDMRKSTMNIATDTAYAWLEVMQGSFVSFFTVSLLHHEMTECAASI